MRNLKLLHHKKMLINLPQEAKLIVLDNYSQLRSDTFYVTTEEELFCCHSKTGDTQRLLQLPGIVAAEFISLDTICLAASAGEVLLLNVKNAETSEATYCADGIARMAWSADQEVVAFITKSHNLVVMNCAFDVLHEHALEQNCEGAGQFVNVGWGKKETQFHGSEGKMAAKQKQEFQMLQNVQQLPQNIELSWRADGDYFVVSFLSSQWGRMFKVFNKEGELYANSEKLNNLGAAIAWRPTGNWIAVPQQLPNKCVIALFEKNGLRHREIVLPFTFDKEQLLSLSWSADATILSIQTRCEQQDLHKLYLYTIGNYHWYLKQQISFALSNAIATYSWDSRMGEEKSLHLLLQNGEYINFSFQLAVNAVPDTGIVSVIDGCKLLLYDFAKAIVPPPMCQQQLTMPAPINACCMIVNGKQQLQLAIYTANDMLHLLKAELSNPLQFAEVLQLSLADFQLQPLQLGNLFWCHEQHLFALSSHGNSSKIHSLTVPSLKASAEQIFYNCCTLANEHIALFNGNSQQRSLYLQAANNSIYELPFEALLEEETFRAQQLYAELDSHIVSAATCTAGLISLTANQCLYLHAQRLATDVTSFYLLPHFVAFTKHTQLIFVPLQDLKQRHERKIENGGKLITIIAEQARTVLQMPRGNLESICPRVLTLKIVAQLLEDLQYKKSLDLCRKQRINLNILCDHDLLRFVQNMNAFLQDVDDANWLNLFLADLKNEDFTKSMYFNFYATDSRRYPEDFKITNKVSYICERFCKAMEQLETTTQHLHLPLITAYVKVDQTAKALEMIWQAKLKENANAEAVVGVSQAETALRHLLYLVDVNDLYNVALGTYDFSLVLFVAQKSQKDPKEYVPFLNELKKLELNYRKYKIDEHLRQHQKALQHIAACGSIHLEEAVTFVQKHELFQFAMKCYAEQPDCYERICLAFADDLRVKNKLEEASLLYERAGNLEQSMNCARNVLNWQRVLLLAKTLQLPSDEMQLLVKIMVAALQQQARYEDAYQLQYKHGNDWHVALQCLLNGKLHLKAIYECKLQDMDAERCKDLLETQVKPALLQHCNETNTYLTAELELFLKHKQRLLMLREESAKRQLLCNGDIDVDDNIDECDLLSDTTSMRSSRYTGTSRGSNKTFRSSKNRRKHERKLFSLKPGHPLEDIALIDALYNQISNIAKQQQSIGNCCKALLELQLDATAVILQQCYKQLLNTMQQSLEEIWIPELKNAQTFELNGAKINYAQLRNEQRYELLAPEKRYKPALNLGSWENEILHC